MADYSKMKNADLEALLKERGLPHTGKKAELVKRLQEADATGAQPAKKDEDEIDWDDEPATAAAAATLEPAATAIKAGGTGQPPNPQAVPNQQADIDPAKTDDLKVEAGPSDAAPETAQSAEEVKPAKDFTAGIATSTVDEEIAKRKARAKKFGLDESTDETLKALERAKKFGQSDSVSDKLNQALPERRERKRGREVEESADSRKRGRPGMRGGRRGSGRPNGEGRPAPRNATGGSSQMSEADRAKAEARKARFATAS
ncbi:SAP domain-containing protein 2 [Elsinoe australis]|uniref:SAP domain-containing protein 2 n=1 Tax=Elsinoe australis TaxID=40998 RepID=A0A4U7B488_9PEZI|nr:SAP domain-containing protein 2 [Elsinoe australis]